jgi:hypothetical protein
LNWLSSFDTSSAGRKLFLAAGGVTSFNIVASHYLSAKLCAVSVSIATPIAIKASTVIQQRENILSFFDVLSKLKREDRMAGNVADPVVLQQP